MEIFRQIFGHLIFFSCGLAMLMALAQFFNPAKRAGAFMLAGLFASVSLVLLEHYTVVYSGLMDDFFASPLQSTLLYSMKFMKFAIGPFFYLYIKSLIDRSFTFSWRSLAHFLPVLALLVYIYAGAAAVFYALKTLDTPLFGMLNIAATLSVIHMLGYLIYTLKDIRIRRITTTGDGRRTIFIALVATSLVIVILIPLSAFLFVRQPVLESVSSFLAALFIIAMFIVGQRYPEFVHWIGSEIKKARYERSLITGLDTDSIISRMEDIMEDEKLYCDEDITLSRLADHLSISTHQLSELLNNRLNTNFNSYINTYRIEEAKRLLCEDPNRSILSVAYACGFNSKSVFYSAFSKSTGKSPALFRNEILDK